MALSRRDFVRVGTTTALLGALPGTRLLGQPLVTTDGMRLDDLAQLAATDLMKSMALRAADAAKAAGATYADVHVVRKVTQVFDHPGTEIVRARINDTELLAFSVRALVNGYWGFAASPYWEIEEAVQLAQSAVQQAKNNALGPSRTVEWETLPAVTGSWVTPGIDPFSIVVEEKVDFMNGWKSAVQDALIHDNYTVPAPSKMQFTRIEKVMASTEGTLISQTYYGSGGEFAINTVPRDPEEPQQASSTKAKFPGPGNGWESIIAAKVRDQIPQMVEDIRQRKNLTYKPVEIGRYDMVVSGMAAATMLSSTLGRASILERAMGYDANTTGTSYLGPDPMDFLGKSVASSLLNVTAKREGTKWDDEAVEPEEFTLVKDGMLMDYLTTREEAPWIKSWYQQQQRPVKSHGCASTPWMSITGNGGAGLKIQPGTTPASFESMVAGIKQGYAFIEGYPHMDFQAKTGMGRGLFREIVDGKLGDISIGAGFLFGSMEFWKNVTAVGDASKEGPVPITVKGISVIDARRRA